MSWAICDSYAGSGVSPGSGVSARFLGVLVLGRDLVHGVEMRHFATELDLESSMARTRGGSSRAGHVV